jgi:hypothetical protein
MKKDGMVVALLAEYQKAAIEYKEALTQTGQAEYERIADKETSNKDCESIQSLTFHVVQSGYTYANYIQSKINTTWLEYQETILTPEDGIVELDKMLAYTASVLDQIYYHPAAEIRAWTYATRWGVVYDFEQLMEHAIVHVLRHRRQVVGFLNIF